MHKYEYRREASNKWLERMQYYKKYEEYFFEYLVPWVHYIPVKRDTSDLLENTIWILQNSEKAKVIAENAFAFAMKYLTREAACKQWNAVITGTRPTF